jgi:AAA family ATP:ADP antiporter
LVNGSCKRYRALLLSSTAPANKMNTNRILERWLDVRPNEAKKLWLLTLGAFLLLGFVVLCRSLREASFLESFDVEWLPYLKVGQAALVLPAVWIFTGLLRHRNPRSVLKALAVVLAAAVVLLWPAAMAHHAGVVAFYLVAALGALVLASGFWVVAAECFAVRGAKRLFGVIIGGGTAGGMVMGLSARWLVAHVGTAWWGVFLVVPLLLLLVVVSLLPGCPRPVSSSGGDADEKESSSGQNLTVIWRSPYLRALALILLAATAASALVDFQFLKYVDGIGDEKSRAAFLGAFYGWAGGIALLIQILVASRVMSSASVFIGLSIVPVFLLLGSTAILVVPGLLAATVLRGGDYSLRKSLLRPMMEFLYVPLPESLRRRTKSIIDVAVDSAGEVGGSLLILLLINLLGVPVKYLAVPVAAISVYLILMSRRMGGLYLEEIVRRLSDGKSGGGEVSLGRMLQDTHLLTASYSRLDIQSLLATPAEEPIRGEVSPRGEAVGSPRKTPRSDTLAAMRSADNGTVLAALKQVKTWDDDHIRALARLLVRNEIRGQVEAQLMEAAEGAVTVLSGVLGDESADFVLRRRIPRALAALGGIDAENALLAALSCGRFEVRYRSAIALVRLQKRGALKLGQDRREAVWSAVSREAESNRPIWEMQRLLDDLSLEEEDDLVISRVGVRGELSLEHTFRMLTLVLDPEPVRAAFHGIVLNEEGLKSFALEYLEQVLPAKIRERLWLFIGDISEYRKAEELRPIGRVVSDLMSSRATLFGGEADRDALKRLLTDEGGE